MTSTFISWLKFNAVGAVGVGVQLAVLTFLKSVLGLNYLLATAVAVETTVIHNFVWHERWTWAHRAIGPDGVFLRLLRFNAGNGMVSLFVNVVLMWLFVAKFHVNYLIASAVAIGICSIINFLISDRLVFKADS